MMDNIQKLYKDRNRVSKDLITRAFYGELTDKIPVSITDCHGSLTTAL